MTINELKQKRTQLIEEMQGIVNKAEVEKRAKSPEELEKWNTLDGQIEDLDKEIKVAERQAELNKSIARKADSTSKESGEDKEIKKMEKRYDFLAHKNAIVRGTKIEGVAGEIHAQGMKEWEKTGRSTRGDALYYPSNFFKRATVTTSTNQSDISEIVDGMVITAAPSLLNQLGVRIMNMKADVKLNWSDGLDAAFVAEGTAVGESSRTQYKDTLSSRRVGGYKNYSNEYIAQSEVFPVILSDMNSAVERAVTKELLDTLVALSGVTLSGYDSSDTATGMTYEVLKKLPGALETDAFASEQMVMTKALYHALEATSKDSGSGRFIIEAGRFDAAPAWGTSLLGYSDTGSTKAQIIYGDFTQAIVNYFTGYEVIINPYANDTSGETKFTYNRIADVSGNNYRFKSIRNASV